MGYQALHSIKISLVVYSVIASIWHILQYFINSPERRECVFQKKRGKNKKCYSKDYDKTRVPGSKITEVLYFQKRTLTLRPNLLLY